MKKDNEKPKEKEVKYPKVLEELKQNIRQIRRDKGFRSAESFAEYLGVSLKTVQGWENLDNGRWPDLAMMILLCEKTGCDLDHLLGRMEEPTHGIKFIHDQTGLSVEAIRKLVALKGTGMDELLSEIITHKNAAQLLRVLLLAADEDEIAWLNLDELPRGLLSTYADKPIDFSVGIGSDVADFLASQELVSIVRDIRKGREKERAIDSPSSFKKHIDRVFDVYREKTRRANFITEVDTNTNFYENLIDTEDLSEEEIAEIRKFLTKAYALRTRATVVSFAEWKRGYIEQEYFKMKKGIEENGKC